MIEYKDISRFPYEDILFCPCMINGKELKSTVPLHFKDGEILTFPFNNKIDNMTVYKYYIMKYK